MSLALFGRVWHVHDHRSDEETEKVRKSGSFSKLNEKPRRYQGGQVAVVCQTVRRRLGPVCSRISWNRPGATTSAWIRRRDATRKRKRYHGEMAFAGRQIRGILRDIKTAGG
ncbi:hypothetical protein K0M31_004603 [Melipona bicolor]|uniref:Uncharacterized protein n=1 Tax=Melipona bicolor TaxID=60889 RepID=A0AA40FX40_9HYME|nr:hypothetical protein K0M31_004603 [Melipona bicolor]